MSSPQAAVDLTTAPWLTLDVLNFRCSGGRVQTRCQWWGGEWEGAGCIARGECIANGGVVVVVVVVVGVCMFIGGVGREGACVLVGWARVSAVSVCMRVCACVCFGNFGGDKTRQRSTTAQFPF